MQVVPSSSSTSTSSNRRNIESALQPLMDVYVLLTMPHATMHYGWFDDFASEQVPPFTLHHPLSITPPPFSPPSPPAHPRTPTHPSRTPTLTPPPPSRTPFHRCSVGRGLVPWW
jgi:hypothetical protein